MNKTKLLLSTALASSLLIGAANAKMGGSITTTLTLGSDETDAAAAAKNGSSERLGSEVNLTYKGKKDLEAFEGGYVSVKGKVELDDSDATQGGYDNEFEVQIGAGNFYLGYGEDSGNNSAKTVMPYLGYHPGTLAENAGDVQTSVYDLLGEAEAGNYSHLSANFKAAGGTFSYIYAPNTNDGTDDSDKLSGGTGGSTTDIVYRGSPIEGLKIMAARNTQQYESTTTSDDIKVTKIGATYNFGQFSVGYEQQDIDNPGVTTAATNADGADTVDGTEQVSYAVAYKASDRITIGLDYTEGQPGKTSAEIVDEEITTLRVGYDLGGAAIVASYIDAENIGNNKGENFEALHLRSVVKF